MLLNAKLASIFPARVHQQAAGAAHASGCYKVAWTDYFGARSAESAAVCVQDGAPRPFVNA